MQLKLKVVWAKKFLGLAVDQENGACTFPLTNYYFWPKTQAWEQLKIELISNKTWLKEPDQSKTLNLASEIINYWRLNRTKVTLAEVSSRFTEVGFIQGR